MNAQSQDVLTQDERTRGDFQSFAKLLNYARPYWAALGWSIAVLGLASLAGVLSAATLGRLIERGLMARDAQATYSFGAGVLALELAAVAANFYGRRYMARASNASLLLIREKLFSHMNELPMSYFDHAPLGRTVTRLTHDVEGLDEFFSGTLARIVSAALSFVIVLAGMLAADIRLGLMVLAAMVPAALITLSFRASIRHWNREFARRNSAINARLAEFLNGLPVIRAFGAEEWSARNFDDVVDSHLEAAIRVNVINAWSRPVILLLCNIPLALLLYFGGREVIAGTLGVGLFVSFIRFSERFSRPIATIAQEIQTVQAAFTSAERVARFLDHPPESVELGADGTHRPARIRGAIEFQNLWMAYEKEHWVLRNVQLKVHPGEKIGLAGRTGSGKSTTAALLSRLYEFQKGDIHIDERSIRDYSREALRTHIGFVNQDVTIFRGSLYENLSFGLGADPRTIETACRHTGLDAILRSRELTLNSLILEGGSNLSAGEKQLIALTRVLVRNPSLLILDEATANVDERCEELLQKAVLEVMQGRTCFMIAHRLSTLEACDRILVFRGGEIVEHGPHRELLARGGYYAQLLKESEAPAPLMSP